MMTVRHVDQDGYERLFQVDSADRSPEGDLVFGRVQRIATGKVFIMNDAGQTVATYDFSKKK